MKNAQLKDLIKTARKEIRKELQASLVTQLKEVTGRMGKPSKKLEKDIEKGTKQLAKKLSKEVRIDESVLVEAQKNEKVRQEEADASNANANPVIPKVSKRKAQQN